jgi:hypothetical protein
VLASPVVVNGIVYANADDNSLHAYHLP